MLLPRTPQVGGVGQQTQARTRTRVHRRDAGELAAWASGSYTSKGSIQKAPSEMFQGLADEVSILPSSSLDLSRARGPTCEPSTSTTSHSTTEFVKINKRITGLARGALDCLNNKGVDHPLSKKKVDEVLEAYRKLSKRPEALSHINTSTLVHRTAVIVTKAKISDSVFEHHIGLIQNLIEAVNTWEDMFEPRHISNIMWGFGKLGRNMLLVSGTRMSFPVVFSRMMERAGNVAKDFQPQEISNIAVCLANLKFGVETAKPLLGTLAEAGADKIHNFRPQEAANFLWACGRIGYDFSGNGQLVNCFVDAFSELVREKKVSDQQLCNFLWGLAKIKYEVPPKFLQEMDKEVTSRLAGLTPQGVSNLLWAFAKLRYLPATPSLHVVARHIAGSIESFRPQHVANVLYAYAIFGEQEELLASSAREYFSRRKQLFRTQEVCNLLWSLAMLDELDMETFAVAMRVIPSQSMHTMLDSERRQLYQCCRHLQAFCGVSQQELTEVMTVEGEELCRLDYKQGQEEKMVYPVALSVLLTLEKIGLVSQCRYVSDFSPYVIDSAFNGDGLRVAVEVTLPTHYFVNNKDRLRGTRSWAMKFLEAQGLVILRVDCMEWNRLPAKSRVSFIKQQLNMVTGRMIP